MSTYPDDFKGTNMDASDDTEVAEYTRLANCESCDELTQVNKWQHCESCEKAFAEFDKAAQQVRKEDGSRDDAYRSGMKAIDALNAMLTPHWNESVAKKVGMI